MFDFFKLRKKESSTVSANFQGISEPKWSSRKYESFADEGYMKNVVAFQAINKTAKAVASIRPYLVRKKDQQELTAHELLNLLQRPNPQQSWQGFIENVVGYYRLAGNAYIERIMVQGKPRELYTHRPDRFAIKCNDMGITAFVYKNGTEKVTWPVDQITGQSDIRQVKTFNPLDDLYGMSPIEAGARGIDQHNETMTHLQSLLQNQATPTGILWTEKPVSDVRYRDLKADIERRYSGPRNAGKPLLLDNGLRWDQLGLSPTDMGILEIKYSAARDVSLALGVPPLMLNIPGDSTYSNYKEARLAFYEETVIPLADEIIDEINAWMNRIYPDVEIKLDYDSIPAIQEKRQEFWTMIDSSVELTINEKREMKGFGKKGPQADEIYIPSGLIPLSFDSDDADDAGEGTGKDAGEAGRGAYGKPDGE